MVHSRQSPKLYGSQAVSIFSKQIEARMIGVSEDELEITQTYGSKTTEEFIKIYGVNNELNSDRFETNEPAAPKAER